MEELAPGLRRWTVRHEHWEEEVGSIAVDTADGLVLIDPLDPPAELRAPAHVLYTVYWHARDGATLQAGRVGLGRDPSSRSRLGVSRSRMLQRPGTRCRAGFRCSRRRGRPRWCTGCPSSGPLSSATCCSVPAKPRATDDPLRLCPQRWLGKGTHADLRESLRPLLDLPVERVLVRTGGLCSMTRSASSPACSPDVSAKSLVAAGVVVLAALVAGCGGGSEPSQEDVLPVGELTYPGAAETSRNWRPEDHDVSVDGLDLSSVAELSRRFRLREPVARDDLFAWYGEQLEAAGWSEAHSADTAVFFVKSVDDRRQTTTSRRARRSSTSSR